MCVVITKTQVKSSEWIVVAGYIYYFITRGKKNYYRILNRRCILQEKFKLYKKIFFKKLCALNIHICVSM